MGDSKRIYCKEHKDEGNQPFVGGMSGSELERFFRLSREIKCRKCFADALCNPSIK